ncbi:hypothetical protein C1637_24925 [Chryseobacterium lactis]|uniref:Uncharacterized protein n=1 Tax=Chryseobacterium lactis TaxID=1241981 RepID=A0A3G6RDT4_CHRLC|nr:hypothetical protein [Chryseobacterium lactis]AZA82584.1 hypothetical protein EG342_12070 [Chryseobacterium lactis]AZB02965.1 hypothetical protein EG341_02930 [Chryseobacterium lactis]PNW10953.1 hypothetical protein C1637_24925 [Chryseobacterium lactis]
MNTITTHLKYFSKLSAAFIFSVLKIYGIGVLSTIITLVSGIYILSDRLGPSLGHTSAIGFIITTIQAKPVSAGIFYLLMIIAPFFTIVFASKYAMSVVINKLLQDHSKTIVVPFVDKVIGIFKTRQPTIIRTSGDFAIAKMKLLNEFRNSSENKLLKRIVGYALNKIKFDELNLGADNADFSDIIKTQLLEKLNELAEPSALLFYIYIGLQWISLALLYFLNR